MQTSQCFNETIFLISVIKREKIFAINMHVMHYINIHIETYEQGPFYIFFFISYKFKTNKMLFQII